MANIKPIKIPGKWREGFALDYHTVSSTYLGDDDYGHPVFDTKRSEIGELLYRLKYRGDAQASKALVDAAASFTGEWKPGVTIIVPVPASKARAVQPVITLAEGLAKKLGIPLIDNAIRRTRAAEELKDVYEYDERLRLLENLHEVNPAKVSGHNVLLVDDLFRSGATMNAVTTALYEQGRAADVYALTMTRTRSHR